ncbi:MAG: type II toxin-antitoxin system RelE/ParE family toxin [Ferrovibrio sp.]|uniref:type II toxin-antitoxin system RelE/ParE family toxin n=1 Tax=Ferrovibrio sp. TaxID=1917215 RepID=UPI0026199F3C|nr:type II toxin-antitoxin system RelE/ParE family toxin [Ferrovibrio sp.]MCW0236665.1 type II toxin-antitoxin system RelE/ParE family toxin [Ferrovibrio sp.]
MTGSNSKRVRVVFYQTATEVQPVRDWLRSLPPEDRWIVGQDIKTLEMGWPIGMPVCRPLGGGLYEVRSSIRKGKVETRVYLAIEDGLAVLLHYQQGKAGQDREIRQARKLLSDYRRRKQ